MSVLALTATLLLTPALASESTPEAELVPADVPALTSTAPVCHRTRRHIDQARGIGCPTPKDFWAATGWSTLAAGTAWSAWGVSAGLYALSGGSPVVAPLVFGTGAVALLGSPLIMAGVSAHTLGQRTDLSTSGALIGGLVTYALYLPPAALGTFFLGGGWYGASDLGVAAVLGIALAAPVLITTGAKIGGRPGLRRAEASLVTIAPMIDGDRRGLAIQGRF